METPPRIVTAQDLAPQPWRNGGGQTRELLVWPAPGPRPPSAAYPWQLRISLADVQSSGPFSAYPGVQRWIAVVAGAGVRLAFPGATHRVDATCAPLHFDGALAVDCELLDGPTRDLNLMIAAGSGRMAAARAGQPWRSAQPLRGLFTRVAGTWRDDAGRQYALAAQSLLWQETAADSAWQFLPDAPADAHESGDGPPGWWLDYCPPSMALDPVALDPVAPDAPPGP